MHDLIQVMGRNIVRGKANKEPGRYSRLWDTKDIIDVLTNDTGTVETEGLVLKNAYGELSKEAHIPAYLPDYPPRMVVECTYELRASGNVRNRLLGKGAFRNMNRLRLLEVHNRNLGVAPNCLPNSLSWLHWAYYPAKSLPGNFEPRNLISLDLSGSPTLHTFPDISGMPNLEVLHLPNCQKLLEVHPSVGVHKKLVDLDLSSCYNLEKFPRTIQMDSLEILNLGVCSGLQDFPEIHSNMSRLRILNVRDTPIEELPWSVGRLTSLQEIDMSCCHSLRALPSSLCGLKYLESIVLSDCYGLKYFFDSADDEAVHCFDTEPSSLKRKRAEDEDDEDVGASKMLTVFLSLPLLRTLHMISCHVSELVLPESIGCLTSLQELDLGGNDFVSLPESINCFSCLQVLRLEDCIYLKALPELPSRITELDLDGCAALTRISNLLDLLDKYENLHCLSLAYCEQLVQKQDQFDTPQANTLRQSLPKFLLALSDWRSVTDVLCKRQEVLQICFPRFETFHWLHQSTGPQATVNLSPSWYNDKLRGFVICAISEAHNFKVVAGDGIVTIIPFPHNVPEYDPEHTAFFYIPIGKITSGRDWNEQKDRCLLEVTNCAHVGSWGIRLVYDGDVNKDIGNFIIINHYGPMIKYENPTMEVCVTPKNPIRDINTM